MTAAGHTSDLRSLLVPADCHIGGADALTFFSKKLAHPTHADVASFNMVVKLIYHIDRMQKIVA